MQIKARRVPLRQMRAALPIQALSNATVLVPLRRRQMRHVRQRRLK